MIRSLLSATFILAVAMPALGEDKIEFKKLKGAWARETKDGAKLVFDFKDEKTMLVKLTNGDGKVEIEADYSIDGDGKLTGIITKSDAKDGNGPPKDTKFGFKIELGKEKMVLSNLTGVEGAEAKELVEGEYKKKTD
jgi:hypothetical protein